MKRTLLSFAALSTLVGASALLSGCATTSETASTKTNPAEMLGQQRITRGVMDMQSASVDAAGRK